MAKFETKLDVGKSAYYIEDNKIKEGEVEEINVTISYNAYYTTSTYEVSYTLKGGERKVIEESNIFPTIEELLKNLESKFYQSKVFK